MSAPARRPRNPVAFAAGQRNREIIKGLMLDRAARHPLLWPLTDEQMQVAAASRGVYLSVSAIAWHMREIRREAAAEKVAGKSNVSCGQDLL